MANSAAIVALLAALAVARHVAVSTACVAGLLASAEATASIEPLLAALVVVAVSAGRLGAVPGYMSDLTTLIAFGTAARASRTARTASLGASLAGALAREMARLAAAVAGLLLRRTSAVAAQMAFLPTIVAGRIATLRAFSRLMSSLATVVAGASSGSLVFHLDKSPALSF